MFICLGERIMKASDFKAGDGTYVNNGYICASLAGIVQKFTDENGQVSSRGKYSWLNSANIEPLDADLASELTKQPGCFELNFI